MSCKTPCHACDLSINILEQRIDELKKHLETERRRFQTYNQPRQYHGVLQKEVIGNIQEDIDFLREHLVWKSKKHKQSLV